MIETWQCANGVWIGQNDLPLMHVEGDSETIVRGIVERNLVWYHAKQALRANPPVSNEVLEAELVDLAPKIEEAGIRKDEKEFYEALYGDDGDVYFQ